MGKSGLRPDVGSESRPTADVGSESRPTTDVGSQSRPTADIGSQSRPTSLRVVILESAMYSVSPRGASRADGIDPRPSRAGGPNLRGRRGVGIIGASPRGPNRLQSRGAFPES